METFKHPLFIVCSLLFLVHQVLQYFLKLPLPLMDDYLDNLLAMPIILTLFLAEQRHLFHKGKTYHLPLLECILVTVYVSALSEWLFPWLSKRFTFGMLDFLFFFAGAGIFYLTQKIVPASPEKPNEQTTG